jgi:pSer/pThr/pTyr-binding forkhead associated (FHA) protein
MSGKPNGKLIPVPRGDSIPLDKDTLVLGREKSCDVPLRFPNVSHRHAQLSFQQGFWYIRDLNSTNGIKVNGERVVYKLLQPKDEIAIGGHIYKIRYDPPDLPERATGQDETVFP